MQSYAEHRLTQLHINSVQSKIKDRIFSVAFSIVTVITIPLLHLGVFYHMLATGKPIVNKQKCTCNCFDTIFRGKYEWPPSTYKHVYFNTTSETLKIWIIITLGIIACYEASKRVITLMKQRHIRWDMFALLIGSIYPHYYGWWNFFQYVNEEFYDQWYHQTFFSLTEIISTAMVIHLADSKNNLKPWKLLLVLNISMVHIIVSSLDQFINNVIHNKGQDFEILRDLGLMFPDILHVLVAFLNYLACLREEKNP